VLAGSWVSGYPTAGNLLKGNITMFDAGFATLDGLKERLRISDTSEDTLLQDLLVQTAAAIERTAGRTLRRRHKLTEYPQGGETIIRLGMTHIAKVHSVRESSTRDFTTSGAYTELEKGTDYVLEGGRTGEQQGESGILRRLNGQWLGTESSPGQVQVIYTGGFKTDEEIAAENKEFSIEEASGIMDYVVESIQNTGIGLVNIDDPDMQLDGTTTVTRRALLRFNLENILLPTWAITRASLRLAGKTTASPGSIRIQSIRVDPIFQGDLDLLATAYADTYTELVGDLDYNSASYVAASQSIDSQLSNFAAIKANMLETIATNGFIAFVLSAMNVIPSAQTLDCASSENAIAALKPKLTLRHGITFADPYTTPEDLRRANLIQAVHDYKTRATPGIEQESARGVSIASGTLRVMRPVNLLPAVKEVAESYRRMY